MIKLKGLDKYYNKNSSSQIHVIDNINLEFPDKGLIVLLGHSGSGKTSLLNVIGGLDKVNKGSVIYDDFEIKRYSNRKWDFIRNDYVGYIFQNYNLLNDMTVYDNISLVLKMVGFKEGPEISKRINYVLKSVGLEKYKKRLVSMLSGGQQQRVAIARAIVKNPKIIIADEPTGNLDSKNTNHIMRIIKKISQTKLVVLVTHEENIANFYSDRIIVIKDGKVISDKENIGVGSLDVREDNEIYLQDMEKTSISVDNSNNNINIFTDNSIDLKGVNINLIVNNGRVFVEAIVPKEFHYNYIDSNSDFEIINAKYKNQEADDDLDIDFDLKEFENTAHITKKRISVISVKETIKLAFNRIKATGKKGKMIYVSYALCGALVAFCVGNLGHILSINDDKFIEFPKEFVAVEKIEPPAFIIPDEPEPIVLGIEEIYDLKEDGVIDGFVFKKTSMELKFPSYIMAYKNSIIRTNYLLNDELLNKNDLVFGRMIENDFEIVIDKRLADSILSGTNGSVVDSYEDITHIEVELNAIYPSLAVMNFDVVGIVNSDISAFYGSEIAVLASNSTEISPYAYFANDIEIAYGVEPTGLGNILIPYDGLYDQYIVDGELIPFEYKQVNYNDVVVATYSVVGMYNITNEDVELSSILGNEKTLAVYMDSKLADYSSETNYYVYSDDSESLIKELQSRGYSAYNIYDEDKEQFYNKQISESFQTVVLIIFIVTITGTFFYFIIRSSLMSRIREISIYRALGVTKFDVRKMFVIEIMVITTISTLIGYFIGIYILDYLQNGIDNFISILNFGVIEIIGGVIFIYITNIIAGLIPVNVLLIKTPSEILTKYDL